MRFRLAYELVLALAAVATVTAVYALVAQEVTPRPGGLLGHGLGIVGFLMMLSTETVYSVRKRMPGIALGRMSVWLQAHIFTGIVGPCLTLLHSAGKFNGLAGLLTVLTVVMVVSGFIGRFIYTAVPRTLEGDPTAAGTTPRPRAGGPSETQVQSLLTARRLLALWHLFHIPLGITTFALAFLHIGGTLYYATFLR